MIFKRFQDLLLDLDRAEISKILGRQPGTPKSGQIKIFLRYDAGANGIIRGLRRISKPSRRMYLKSKDIKPVLDGLGIAVISTSKGIMTDKQARKENVGGEILCKIW